MTTTRRARVRDCPDLRMMTIRSGIAPTFKYTCIVWVRDCPDLRMMIIRSGIAPRR